MWTATALRRVGNKLYKRAFPIYRPLYSAYKKYADRAERRLIRNILPTGAVAVDVGANIGVYSKFLAQLVGCTGVVHAFEPSPDNFRRLQSATRNLSNVRLSRAAVGDHSGRSQLYLSNVLNVDHRAYAAKGDSRRIVPIDIIALDDYFKPSDRVDFIKLDIQGYELHALRGARRVLHDNPAVKLIVELWPYGLKEAGTAWTELIATLEAKGMVIQQLSPEGLMPFVPELVQESATWYRNLFARRES
jgi:FkbM family methyltransferase